MAPAVRQGLCPDFLHGRYEKRDHQIGEGEERTVLLFAQGQVEIQNWNTNEVVSGRLTGDFEVIFWHSFKRADS